MLILFYDEKIEFYIYFGWLIVGWVLVIVGIGFNNMVEMIVFINEVV